MNRLHAFVIGAIAIASVSIAVFLYYYFMPAWVYVEVTPSQDDVDVVTLTDDDMARYPILQRLVLLAEESRGFAPSLGIEQTSRDEAIEIANLLEIRDESRTDRGTFIYNGTTYYIHITYQYGGVGLA